MVIKESSRDEATDGGYQLKYYAPGVGNVRVGWGGAKDKSQEVMELVKVEKLSKDLTQVRLFHTSVTRAVAIWPTWPGEPGFTGDFEDYIAAKFQV